MAFELHRAGNLFHEPRVLADVDDSLHAVAGRRRFENSVAFSSVIACSRMRFDVASGLPSRLTAMICPSGSFEEITTIGQFRFAGLRRALSLMPWAERGVDDQQTFAIVELQFARCCW